MSNYKYEARKWFFTSDDDIRGLYASKFLFDAGFQPINEEPQAIKGKLAFDFLKASNFTKKDFGMTENDIHYQITDFIVKTALYHKEVDKSTTVSTQLEGVMTSLAEINIKDQIKQALGGTTLQNINTPLAADAGNLISNDIKETLSKHINQLPNAKNAIDNGISESVKSSLDVIASAYPAYQRGNVTGTTVGSFIDDKWNEYKDLINNKVYESIKKATQNYYSMSYTTLANSPEAKKIYDNVYANWNKDNKVDQDSKDLYKAFMVLLVRSGAEWKVVDEMDYGKENIDYNNYRLNLVKRRKSDVIKFGDILPKIWLQQFQNVYYTSTDKSHKKIPLTNDNFFRDLYQKVYRGNDFENIPKDLPKTYAEAKALYPEKNFDYNVDNLVKQRIFRISEAPISKLEYDAGLGKTYAVLDMKNSSVWNRNEKGDYYKKINNQWIRMGAEDKETDELLKANHNCYNIGSTDTGEKCKEFIFECLLSEDANSLSFCLNRLKTEPDFLSKAKGDISNLHPILALRILQKFGFKKHSVYDEQANAQIWKVEDVNHWIKNFLKTKFPKEDIEWIIKDNNNNQLLTYVDLISQYVNANPGILNKGYEGVSEEGVGMFKLSDFAKRLKLQVRKEPSKQDSFKYDINRFKKHIQVMKTSKNPFFTNVGNRATTPFGRDITPGLSLLSPQFGGGNCEYVIKKLNSDEGIVTGSRLIKNYVESLMYELGQRNKTLAADDKRKIEDNIAKLREVEEGVLRTICYIDEYNRLLDVFGDYSSETLTEAKLKQFVNRLDTLYGKQQSSESTLVDILSKILELVDTDNGGEYKELP